MTMAAYKIRTAAAGLNPLAAGIPTHGQQVSDANTGHLAYYDPSLSRRITDSDLTEISGTHWISDYVGNGGSFEKVYFSGNIVMDRNNVTFKGCKFANTFVNFKSGVHATGTVLEYCTVNPVSRGDEAIRFQNYTAKYCLFAGCSDGAKANGGTTALLYCHIRLAGTVGDHNDGIQNVGGSGTVLIRGCNINAQPVNNQGSSNACVMSGDMSASSTLSMVIEDCFFSGGSAAYQLRLYDGGLTPNITYTVSNNTFVRGVPALDRGSTNTTPTNQVTWTNNTYSDNGDVIPLV